MKILDPGHKYEVDTYDGNNLMQVITFMKRQGEKFPFNSSAYPGTNCQEIVRVLIDRVKYLNKQKAHSNNRAIIKHLQEILWLFEDRAASEHHIDQFNFSTEDIELEKTCKTCGHIICLAH